MTTELIDSIAADLGVAAEARKKWRQRGRVPHRWRLPILQAAAARGLTIPQSAFEPEPASCPAPAAETDR